MTIQATALYLKSVLDLVRARLGTTARVEVHVRSGGLCFLIVKPSGHYSSTVVLYDEITSAKLDVALASIETVVTELEGQ